MTDFNERILNAYYTITGLNPEAVRNIVSICDQFDINLESVMARAPGIRQYTDPDELEEKLFAEIGKTLVTLVNEDYAEHLGVLPNIEKATSNTFQVWFEFQENADDTELCLAIKKNPEALKQMHPRSLQLVFDSTDPEKILSDINAAFAQKYFEEKTGRSR